MILFFFACTLVTDDERHALLDPDQDGAPWPEDCDNRDPSVFPGARELCDGRETDCDPETTDTNLVTIGAEAFSTITEAIAAAEPGATLIICPGTYTENLEIDRDLTLSSLAGAATTVVTAAEGDSTVVIASGVAARLVGLSITGGTGRDQYGDGDTSGGGLLASELAVVEAEDVIITGNTATFGGGAWLGAGSSFSGTEVSFRENTTEVTGGGLYLDDGATLLMSGGSFTSNNATYGGGLFVSLGAYAEMDGTTLSANSASYLGGAMDMYSQASVRLINTIVDTNYATTYGGGFNVDTSAQLTLEGCTISNNESYRGGGIYLYEGTATLDDATVLTLNYAQLGGGVVTDGGTLIGGVLRENQAFDTTGDPFFGGGAIYNVWPSIIEDVVMEENYSDGPGGAVYVVASLNAIGVTLRNNFAQTDGGGVLIAGDGSVTLETSTVVANTANRSGGGAYVEGGTLISTGTEWGSAAEENAPDDVAFPTGTHYNDFATDETFRCDTQSDVCE